MDGPVVMQFNTCSDSFYINIPTDCLNLQPLFKFTTGNVNISQINLQRFDLYLNISS